MLFKIVFFLVFVIAFVPPVRRFVFYLLVGRQLVKAQKRATQPNRPVRDGETVVQKKSTNTGPSPQQSGEYVDYEEVN